MRSRNPNVWSVLLWGALLFSSLFAFYVWYRDYSREQAQLAVKRQAQNAQLKKQALHKIALDQEVSLAKQAISSRMLDPNSAEFEITLVTYNPPVVCGMVNSKNSYGAYVGRRPFIAMLTKGVVPQSVGLAKVAGQDWKPCDICYSWEDYFAADSSKVISFCAAAGKVGEK